MAWCPKCKNEYREGITVCADCGVELVEHLEDIERTALIFGEEEQMNALKKFMEYNGLEGIEVSYDEREAVYELSVREADKKKAAGIARVFMQQKAAEQEEQEPEETPEVPAANRLPYQSSEEKAENNRSAALVLVGVSLVGFIVMYLCMFGVLPFSIGDSYIFYSVMCTIFILFMVMGAVSLRNARIFEQKIESENSLKETLENWCREHLKAEEIDAELRENGCGEGEFYFMRYEKLKEKLNRQFMNLDQDFLDHFIDTEVYDMVFPQETERS